MSGFNALFAGLAILAVVAGTGRAAPGAAENVVRFTVDAEVRDLRPSLGLEPHHDHGDRTGL